MLMLPVMVFVAVRLMHICKVKLLKWTYYLFFSMIWLSLLFALLFGDSFGSSYVSPGGMHGMYLMTLLDRSVGIVGTVLLMLLTLIVFMITVSRNTVVWMRKSLTFGAGSEEEALRRERNAAVYEPEETEEIEQPEDDTVAVVGEDELPENGVEIEIAGYDEDDEEPAGDEEGGEEPEDELLEVDIDGDAEENEVSGFGTEQEVPGGNTLDEDELAAKFDEMSKGIGCVNTGAGGISMEVEQAGGDEDMGGDMLRPLNPKDELSYYKPPTIDLLDEYEQSAQSIDKDEQAANANRIVEVLRNFGIEISSIKATVGPTITLYEITPAPGVRISTIRNSNEPFGALYTYCGSDARKGYYWYRGA